MAHISDPSSDCVDVTEGESQNAPTPSKGHFSLSDADSEIVEREVNQISYEEIPEIGGILFSSAGSMRSGDVNPSSPIFQAQLKHLMSSEGEVEAGPEGMNGEKNPEVSILTPEVITLSDDDDIIEVGRVEKCPRHPRQPNPPPVTVTGTCLATAKNDNPIKQVLASLRETFTEVLTSGMSSTSKWNIALMVEIDNMRTGLGEWNKYVLAKFQAMETDQSKLFHLVDQITLGVIATEKNAEATKVGKMAKRKYDMNQGSTVEEAGTSRGRGRPAKSQAMPMPTHPVRVRKMPKRKCKPSSAEEVWRPKKKGRPAKLPAMPTPSSPGQLTIISSNDDEGDIDESNKGRYIRWTKCVPSPTAGPSKQKKSKGPCNRQG